MPSAVGRYEIRRELGRGAMGVVYEAYDPDLGRTIALKTLLPVPQEERETFEQRFFAEARAARLAHPGIVVVHDVGRDAATGTLFLALEYLEGRTLSDVAAEGRSTGATPSASGPRWPARSSTRTRRASCTAT